MLTLVRLFLVSQSIVDVGMIHAFDPIALMVRNWRAQMNIEIQHTEGGVSIRLAGDLDAHAANEARASFSSVCNDMQGDVTIVMSNVHFLDSSGVGAIIFMFKRLVAQGRKLTLSDAVGQPADLLKMLRVDKAVDWQQAA
jgi:anti-anti-sigma factor